MLAAARGLCGREAGITCILGTGSNSCFYDGKEIVNHISPLGFILGDEGSGAVLGKLLVGDILKNQLSPAIKEAFLKQFDLTVPEIIDRVYRQPFPNRFLASLSPFIAQHLEEPGIRQLVLGSFIAFLRRNVMQYDYTQYPAHFIGSVAHCYKEILQERFCKARWKDSSNTIPIRYISRRLAFLDRFYQLHKVSRMNVTDVADTESICL